MSLSIEYTKKQQSVPPLYISGEDDIIGNVAIVRIEPNIILAMFWEITYDPGAQKHDYIQEAREYVINLTKALTPEIENWITSVINTRQTHKGENPY